MICNSVAENLERPLGYFLRFPRFTPHTRYGTRDSEPEANPDPCERTERQESENGHRQILQNKTHKTRDKFRSYRNSKRRGLGALRSAPVFDARGKRVRTGVKSFRDNKRKIAERVALGIFFRYQGIAFADVPRNIRVRIRRPSDFHNISLL